MKKFILYTIVFLVIGFILGRLIENAVRKNDIANCHKYQSYSETYPDFYITKTQKSICENVGVEVMAVVK